MRDVLDGEDRLARLPERRSEPAPAFSETAFHENAVDVADQPRCLLGIVLEPDSEPARVRLLGSAREGTAHTPTLDGSDAA